MRELLEQDGLEPGLDIPFKAKGHAFFAATYAFFAFVAGVKAYEATSISDLMNAFVWSAGGIGSLFPAYNHAHTAYVSLKDANLGAFTTLPHDYSAAMLQEAQRREEDQASYWNA